MAFTPRVSVHGLSACIAEDGISPTRLDFEKVLRLSVLCELKCSGRGSNGIARSSIVKA